MESAHQEALKIHEDAYYFYRKQVAIRNRGVADLNSFTELQQAAQGRNFDAAGYVERVRSLKISGIKSDSSREWVGFLMTQKTYRGPEFEDLASKVAVGAVIDKWRKNYKFATSTVFGLSALYTPLQKAIDRVLFFD